LAGYADHNANPLHFSDEERLRLLTSLDPAEVRHLLIALFETSAEKVAA
jgi:hypothetical protein